jgi:hypothetical protein
LRPPNVWVSSTTNTDICPMYVSRWRLIVHAISLSLGHAQPRPAPQTVRRHDQFASDWLECCATICGGYTLRSRFGTTSSRSSIRTSHTSPIRSGSTRCCCPSLPLRCGIDEPGENSLSSECLVGIRLAWEVLVTHILHCRAAKGHMLTPRCAARMPQACVHGQTRLTRSHEASIRLPRCSPE